MATVYDIKNKERHERIERKMIADHKKKKLVLKPYKVPGDPCKTVFYCHSKERGERKVNEYIREHKAFWL